MLSGFFAVLAWVPQNFAGLFVCPKKAYSTCRWWLCLLVARLVSSTIPNGPILFFRFLRASVQALAPLPQYLLVVDKVTGYGYGMAMTSVTGTVLLLDSSLYCWTIRVRNKLTCRWWLCLLVARLVSSTSPNGLILFSFFTRI